MYETLHFGEVEIMGSGMVFGANGPLFLSDYEDGQVLEIRRDGQVVGMFASGVSKPKRPAFGADGHLYVPSFENGEVLELDPTGEVVRSWSAQGRLTGVQSVGFDASGRLYAASAALSGTFLRLASDDTVAQQWQLGDMVVLPEQWAFGAAGDLFCLRVPSQGPRRWVRMPLGGNPVEYAIQGSGWSPFDLALAPYRLSGKLKGRRVEDGGQATLLKGAATLQFRPGEGRATLWIEPSPLADALGQANVFSGVTVREGTHLFEGAFQGRLLSKAPRTGKSGRIAIRFDSRSEAKFKGKPAKVRLVVAEPTAVLDLEGSFLPANH